MGAAARCGGVCFLLTLLRITGDDELANPVFVDYVPRQRRARRATAACEAWNMTWKRSNRQK